MKKLFFGLSFLFSFLLSLAQSTTIDTTINGFDLRITYQAGLYQRTDSSEMIIYWVGLGEISGTTITSPNTTQYQQDTSRLAVWGPHSYKRKTGWDGGVLMGDGIKRYPVIVTFQTTAYGSPPVHKATLDVLMSKYRVKKNSLHMCGPSMGGWRGCIWATYQPTAGDLTYCRFVKSVVTVDPVIPDDTYDATPTYPSRFHQFAQVGGKMAAFHQINGLTSNINLAVDTMNNVVSGSGFYLQTSYGSLNHCCFDNEFGGNSAPLTYTISGLNENIYQYMLRNGDTTLNRDLNATVVAHAGGTYIVDRTQMWMRLDATGSTGAVASINWRLIDIPNQPTNMYIMRPDQAQPFVKTLIVGTWRYELTVANGNSSSVSKDTCTVVVTWDNPPPQGSGHVATASDTLAINAIDGIGKCRIGDYVITGANDLNVGTGGKNVNIYDSGLLHTVFTPGKRILINASGNEYGSIQILFNLTQCQAISTNKTIITGYGGQLRTNLWNLDNPVNVWVDGEYAAGVSGNKNFLGLAGGYAFRSGHFGIWINNRWQNLGAGCLGISGYADSVTITGCEIGNGGFAGLFIKAHDVDSLHIYNIFRGFHINRNLITNTHGEANYIGDTGGDSVDFFNGQWHYQHLIQGLDYSNNVIVNAGNEGWQGGNEVGLRFLHNIAWLNAINHKSTFDELQDQAWQWDVRNGGNLLQFNMFLGAGRYTVQGFAQSKHRIPGFGAFNGDSTIFSQNVILGGHGDIGGFLKMDDFLAAQRVNWRNNYQGYTWFTDDQVYLYPDSRAVNKQTFLQTLTNYSNNIISFKNNISDNTKTGWGTFSPTFDSSGNKKQTVAFPMLARTGFPEKGFADSFVMRTFERWNFRTYLTWGDEYPNKRSNGVRQGDTIIYSQNALVSFLGRTFKSRQDNNWGNMPYPADSTWWQQIFWTDDQGNKVEMPPNDVRLIKGDPYQAQTIGLTDYALAPGTINNTWINTSITIGSPSNVPCVIYLPTGYYTNPTKRWPVIFSFHGAGEQGTDTVTVTNEGIMKNLKNGEKPIATVGGITYEAIVVAPQSNDYGVPPQWWPGMFNDITSRFHVDSTMIYSFGYSAGTWSTFGTVSPSQTDTSYAKYWSAKWLMSPALARVDLTQVHFLGNRKIPIMLTCGILDSIPHGTETDRMANMRMYYDTTITAASPTIVAFRDSFPGEGHCCWAVHTDTAARYTGIGNKNIYEWLFQFKNTFSQTIPPTSNPGSNQTVGLPSVTLSGSGTPNGGATSITGYSWTKISGTGGTIVSPSSATTTVTGLTPGTYVFQLGVTDNLGNTGTGTVTIIVVPKRGVLNKKARFSHIFFF